MHLLENPSAPCAHCGDGRANPEKRFVDLERDLNWNDPLILCEDCILILAGLLGLPTPDVMTVLKGKVRRAEENEHEARVELDSFRRRAAKLGLSVIKEDKAQHAA
jgi:hypothetical protein